MNTFFFSPCLLCVKVRRPFDTEMFISSICLFLVHFLWIYFGGIRSWVAVYVSSFSQPTHLPFSIYFGYFFGIHSGVWLNTPSANRGNDSSITDEEVGGYEGASKANTVVLSDVESAGTGVSLGKIVPTVDSGGGGGGEMSGKRTCQVTVSNYSWLMRFITFDQSLHCEHHDFPKIPCHLLGKLRHIAPEYYGSAVAGSSVSRSSSGNNQASESKSESLAGVQSYQYFLSPWVKFLFSDPSQYASCTDSLD
jgi:hypothetical protein